jgi:hypothetical protein
MKRVHHLPILIAGLIFLTGLWLAQAAASWLGPQSESKACRPRETDRRPIFHQLVQHEPCRPVLAAEAPRHCPEPEPGPAGAAGRDQPTLAPPEPVELGARREVIVVQVEAEQAADGSDVLQR